MPVAWATCIRFDCAWLAGIVRGKDMMRCGERDLSVSILFLLYSWEIWPKLAIDSESTSLLIQRIAIAGFRTFSCRAVQFRFLYQSKRVLSEDRHTQKTNAWIKPHGSGTRVYYIVRAKCYIEMHIEFEQTVIGVIKQKTTMGVTSFQTPNCSFCMGSTR